MKFQNTILWKQSENERCSNMYNSLCDNKDTTVIEIYHEGVNKLYQMLSTFVLNAPFEIFRVK